MSKQEHLFQKDIENEGKEIAWNVVGGLGNGRCFCFDTCQI